jgi:hypothetical protein
MSSVEKPATFVHKSTEVVCNKALELGEVSVGSGIFSSGLQQRLFAMS